jgi:hypothetical protein
MFGGMLDDIEAFEDTQPELVFLSSEELTPEEEREQTERRRRSRKKVCMDEMHAAPAAGSQSNCPEQQWHEREECKREEYEATEKDIEAGHQRTLDTWLAGSSVAGGATASPAASGEQSAPAVTLLHQDGMQVFTVLSGLLEQCGAEWSHACLRQMLKEVPLVSSPSDTDDDGFIDT